MKPVGEAGDTNQQLSGKNAAEARNNESGGGDEGEEGDEGGKGELRCRRPRNKGGGVPGTELGPPADLANGSDFSLHDDTNQRMTEAPICMLFS